MITQELKAKAVAKLKRNISVEEIAEELELPLSLVEEWAENLNFDDLTVVEGNLIAIEAVVKGMSMDEIESKELILEANLETTALSILKHMQLPMAQGDPIACKALEVCGNTVAKLYETLILKRRALSRVGNLQPLEPSNQGLSVFQQLMKD